MVVCLEAGLSIDQAAIRSSEEIGFSHPAIAEELALVMLEVRAGQARMEAWRHLAERTDVEAIRMFVTLLVQADQFGTGISRTLRVHSDTMVDASTAAARWRTARAGSGCCRRTRICIIRHETLIDRIGILALNLRYCSNCSAYSHTRSAFRACKQQDTPVLAPPRKVTDCALLSVR